MIAILGIGMLAFQKITIAHKRYSAVHPQTNHYSGGHNSLSSCYDLIIAMNIL